MIFIDKYICMFFSIFFLHFLLLLLLLFYRSAIMCNNYIYNNNNDTELFVWPLTLFKNYFNPLKSANYT